MFSKSASARLSPPDHAPGALVEKCRLCRCRLEGAGDDDLTQGLCGSCKTRPEARRLGTVVPHTASRRAGGDRCSQSARVFTAAEKALIRKVHGYLPSQQLLDILNERLACDLGPDAAPYTMEQLYAEIGDAAGAVPAGGHDWTSLRKLLSRAKQSGVLGAITDQIINDFAVVFSLNQKQVLVLKDIVLQAKED
jgi:hypothetical protein